MRWIFAVILLLAVGGVIVFFRHVIPFGADLFADGRDVQSKPFAQPSNSSGRITTTGIEQTGEVGDDGSAEAHSPFEPARKRSKKDKPRSPLIPTWEFVNAKRIGSVEKELSDATRVEEFQPGENPAPAGCFSGSTQPDPQRLQIQFHFTLFLLAVNLHRGQVEFPVEGWKVDDLSYLHVSAGGRKLWTVQRENNLQFLRIIETTANGYFLEGPEAFILQLFPKGKTEEAPAGYLGNFYLYSKESNDFRDPVKVQLDLVGGDVCIADMHD